MSANRTPDQRPPAPATEVAQLAVALLQNGYLTNQLISSAGGIHPR